MRTGNYLWLDDNTVEWKPIAPIDAQSDLFLFQWLGTVGVVLFVLLMGMIAQ